MPTSSSQTGSDTSGLIDYIVGKAERAEAVATQNLFGRTEKEVKREMRLTVKHRENPGGRPLEKPAYHVSINYDPDEEITDQEMLEDMKEFLERRGLGEHQAVLAVHQDKPHPHVHAAVNRVHPQSGKLWRNTFDYDKNMKALRQIEAEKGRMTPEEDPMKGRIADWKYQKFKRTGEKPFGTVVQSVAGDEFAESESWEELQSRLAEYDLKVERKGPGGVVVDRDGEEEAKLSEVASAWSFNKLDEKFSDQYQSHGTARSDRGGGSGDGSDQARDRDPDRKGRERRGEGSPAQRQDRRHAGDDQEGGENVQREGRSAESDRPGRTGRKGREEDNKRDGGKAASENGVHKSGNSSSDTVSALDYRDAESLGEPEPEDEIEPVDKAESNYITDFEKLSDDGWEVSEMLADDRDIEAAKIWTEMSEEQQRQDWGVMSSTDRELLKRAVRKFRQFQEQSQNRRGQSQKKSQKKKKNKDKKENKEKDKGQDRSGRGGWGRR